jgi:hypothetical protein
MKAFIKVVTANKEFTEDQKQIIRRVSGVLRNHNFSVSLEMKIKKPKILQLKAV